MTPAPRRMLVVDDERVVCECLRDFFVAHGFTVAVAFSGEEALAKLAEQSYDVVLLDILLPGIHGLEVLRQLRRQHPLATVVMMTALDEDDLRNQARQLGATAFVTKPFDLSDETWAVVLKDQGVS